MNKKLYFILLVSLLVLLLSGCAAQTEEPLTGAYITGVTLNETEAGQNANFVITIDAPQEDIGLNFWGSFQTGEVTISIVNQDNEEIAYAKTYGGALVNENEIITLNQGEYDLLVSWDKPVTGTYNLEWKPGKVEIPEISPIVLMSGIGMLLVGAIFFYLGVKNSKVSMGLLGGLFWLGTVIVKFIIAGSFNNLIYVWLTGVLPGLPGTIIFSIYVGLLTGVTEILITYLVLKNTKFGKRVWNEIYAFSMGFGAIEAILLGLASLVSMILVLTMTSDLPVSQLRSIAVSNNFFYSFAPIVERFFTILVHLGCNIMIFYSIYKKEMRWFWASFALKSGIDAIAGYAQLSGQLQSVTFIWIIEAFVILFGILGYFATRKLSPELKALTTPAPEEIVE